MELRHLRSFVALAEDLHFGRAASRLHLTQPGLSHHIKQLEREFGTRLFDRGAQAVTLTGTGEALLPEARAALWHAEQAVAVARHHVSGTTGTLRLGMFANGAGDLTGLILRAFRESRPMVTVAITELDLTQQGQALVDRVVDAAVIRPPLSDDRIVTTPIAMEPRVAIIPRHHPLARAPRVMVDDVLSLPVPAVDPATPRAWTNFCRMVERRRGVPVREVGPADVKTQMEMLYAVMLRDALATAGASIAQSYPFRGVAYIPIADIGAGEIAVASRVGEHNPLVELFIATARQVSRRSPSLLEPAGA